MTQTIKKTLILILSALLSISALFFVAPTIAKAEDVNQDKYFTADEGCRLYYQLTDTINGNEVYPILFGISNHEDYAHFLNVEQFGEYYAQEENGNCVSKKTFTLFEFTLWHVLDDSTNAGESTAEKIVTMRIVFGLNDADKPCYAVSYYQHDFAFLADTFYFPKYHEGEKNSPATNTVMDEAKRGGFTIVNSSITANASGPELYKGAIQFFAYASSYNIRYKASFNFRAQARINGIGFLGLGAKTISFESETTETGARSVQYWLMEAFKNEGEIEDTFSEEATKKAYSIVYETLKKDVKINYLVPIEGTPFATRKQMIVEDVPVLDMEINTTDVRRASDFSFDIFDTTAYKFDVVNPETYEYNAYYLYDALVQAETKEEKKVDFFFGLNLSFADVFKIAGNDNMGFLTRQEYEFALSKVCSLYPEVLGSVKEPLISDKNLYGRFGLISIPDRNMTLQGALANALGETEAQFNVTILHQKDGRISKAQYEKLLEEYEYSNYAIFFESLFNGVAGQDEYEATHYLFITEPGKKEIVDGKDPVTPGIGKGLSGIFEGVSNFFGNLGSGFGAFFGSKGGTATIVIIAVLGAGVFVAFRMGAFKGIFKGGSSSKSSSKKRKK